MFFRYYNISQFFLRRVLKNTREHESSDDRNTKNCSEEDSPPAYNINEKIKGDSQKYLSVRKRTKHPGSSDLVIPFRENMRKNQKIYRAREKNPEIINQVKIQQFGLTRWKFKW